MMLSWLTIITISFAAWSSLVVRGDPCRFEDTKGVIDLTSLGRTDGKAAYADKTPPTTSDYKYSYNPCYPFTEEPNCKGVAACQVSSDGKYTFTLGTQQSATWSPGAGLGSFPSVTYSMGEKKAIVSLVCSTDGSEQFEALGELPQNNYKFRLTHKCACWDGCKNPSPPPQQNCTINGTVYTSDKQVIRSFPFNIAINPSQTPLSSSYARVDTNGSVIELTLINVNNVPPALFCLSRLQLLSLHDCTGLSISPEILRLTLSLKSLNVSNPSTSLILPPELFNMTALSTLSLVNCGLETLSNDISKLSQLTELILDQNQLTSLPTTLSQMSSLTFLSINGNPRLSSLDVLQGSTSLRILRGSNCMISQLPTNISKLHTIEMNGNQFRSLDGIESITSASCDVLSFQNNKIISISATALKNIRTLNYLDLSNNVLTELPNSIYQINDLQTLNIHNNNFDQKEVEWIQGVFRSTNTTILM